jgi:hypothetical protein
MARASPKMEKEKIITILILIGLFGGLVGGPVASLADYYAPPERRFWLFIIPEFIGFGCLVLMVIYGKSRKQQANAEPK